MHDLSLWPATCAKRVFSMKLTYLTILSLLGLSKACLHAGDAAALLDLFPKSNAPTFYDKPSEFVVSTQYSPNQRRPSHWTEGVDEKPAFHPK